ncbi:hypothetical protein LZ554_005946 [Drepanopeziza brunnea f. sp. 'monogermtubi']|nr:hypothetical protein LZ554_005946 [Drepanopeziza brunnea f. sp. 'monogermtubi']
MNHFSIMSCFLHNGSLYSERRPTITAHYPNGDAARHIPHKSQPSANPPPTTNQTMPNLGGRNSSPGGEDSSASS